MQLSSSEARRELQKRNQELAYRLSRKLQEVARVVESLAQFSVPVAERVQGQVVQDVEALLQGLRGRLDRAIQEVMEEKESSQEDWDSSLEFHMINQLRRRVEEI